MMTTRATNCTTRDDDINGGNDGSDDEDDHGNDDDGNDDDVDDDNDGNDDDGELCVFEPGSAGRCPATCRPRR